MGESRARMLNQLSEEDAASRLLRGECCATCLHCYRVSKDGPFHCGFGFRPHPIVTKAETCRCWTEDKHLRGRDPYA